MHGEIPVGIHVVIPAGIRVKIPAGIHVTNCAAASASAGWLLVAAIYI